jgi:hypothetical protein
VGKGSPKIEVTEYYMSEHFGVCTGPIDALLSLTVKEKQAWVGEISTPQEVIINKPELFGGKRKEGGLVGRFYYLPGASDQLLPDGLAQRLGRAGGTDCPGFRGLTSLFFYRGAQAGSDGFLWTTNSPYLPGVWATVRRILTSTGGAEQWYPEKAVIASGFTISEEAPEIELVGEMGQSVYYTDVDVPFALTGGLASTPAEGDLVVVIATKSTSPVYPEKDQTPVVGPDYELAFPPLTYGSYYRLAVWYKRMGAAPDTNFTCTSPGSDDDGSTALQVIVLRGVSEGMLASTIETTTDVTTDVTPANITIGDDVIDVGEIVDISQTAFPRVFFTASLALLSESGTSALPMVFAGASTPPSSWSNGNFTTQHKHNAPGAREVESIVIYGEPLAIALGGDMNPAHIIRESLTDTDWGMGTPGAALDGDSFTAAADTLFAENFGLSMIWTRQTSIQSFVQEVLDHIQGVLFVDPATGLLTLKLIRGDYDEETLPELTPDNADLSSFSRKLWGEIVNEIVVSWTNPENEQEEAITAQDLASIATQGGIVSDSRNYYGVRSANLAQSLAFRDLRSAGQPLASCEAEVDRTQWELRPASVVKLTWPEYGLSEVVMRVTSVDYGRPGDPTIKLSLVEDVYGLDIGTYESPPSTEWEDTSADPEPIETVEIFTLPLFLAADTTVAGFTENPEYPEVLAGVLATTSEADTFNYELWDEVTQPNGDLEWESLGTNNIIGRGELADALDAEAATGTVTFDNIVGQTAPSAGGFAIIGEEGEAGNEIAMVDVVDEVYGCDLIRGVLDTVPRVWPAGTPVWFVDGETLFEDPLVRSAGETVSYKLLSRTSQGLLELADAALESATLSERPWLPNRPANVTAYGEAWSTELSPIDARARPDPWVTVTWVNRNRLLEDSQVLAWTDATQTPETGQTTRIEVLAADETPLATHDALSGTSFDVPDASFDGHSLVRLRVYADRSDDDGDFASLQYFEHWVQIASLTFDSTAVTFDSDTWTMDEG